ncbi:MAG: GntR family transcriptional regulator [Nitrospinota bacterium]
MPITSLKPLPKKLLSENVVSAIRTAIFEGELELGQRLVETELAEQLGVSRGPIREALRLLAAEGLVVINVHRGTFVVKPIAADVEEIYTLREALEALAIRQVVAQAADEEFESLQEEVERNPSASRKDRTGHPVGMNMEFHDRLFRLARHKRLSQVWSTLEAQLRLCNSKEIERTRQDVSRAKEEHAKIVKAIRNRDAETACRIMSQHIRNAAQIVQKAIEPSPARA